MTASTAPRLSVVVATHRRAALLPRLFAALARQSVGPEGFELVVVDDASADGRTPELLGELAEQAAFPVQVVLRESNGGPAAARDQGWRRARAATVVFTDDDCTPRATWLAAISSAARPDRVVVGRTVAAPDQEHQRGVFSRTIEVSDATYAQTCNVAYPRALLERLDGFDTRLRTGEDTDLALRARAAGAELHYAPGAVVEHDIRPSRWRSAVREAWSWSDLPAVVGRHPQLRESLLLHRLWWKPTHPRALAAAAGLAVAGRQAGSGRLPWAVLLAAPWVRLRLGSTGAGRRARVLALPGQLAVDLTEVGALARGSVRHRSLLL